jgi:hypothetical protein
MGAEMGLMEEPELRIPLEMAEHLIRQLQDAARATGRESFLKDAEGLEYLVEKQSRPYHPQGPPG